MKNHFLRDYFSFERNLELQRHLTCASLTTLRDLLGLVQCTRRKNKIAFNKPIAKSATKTILDAHILIFILKVFNTQIVQKPC